jgi:acetyltransferase-like isoleucine patch superfamily enzyme
MYGKNKPFGINRTEMYSLKNYILQGACQSFYAFVKNVSLPLFNYVRFAIMVMFMKKLKSTYISEGITFWFPWNIEIGRNTSINQNCIIDGTGGIYIGNDVRIAPYVILNSVDHEFTDKDTPIRLQAYVGGKITIEDDVWIGANVIVNKGVTIGKGSVIGAGSVVTKDIPPFSIAVGVPCKVIRNR